VAALRDPLASRRHLDRANRTTSYVMLIDQNRDARSRILLGPRARMPWPIAPTDEFMGV
jgi:hypothetical protein